MSQKNQLQKEQQKRTNMATNTKLTAPLGVNVTPLDYLVSGTVTSALIAGGINYSKTKKGEISKDEAIKDTIKVSAQTGVASGSAVASLQYLISKRYIAAAVSAAVGVSGVVAIEKFCQDKK